MFDTSKEILHLVLAGSIAVFTVFLCWMLWYLIAMLRDAYSLVKDLRDKFNAVEEAVKDIKDKLDHSAGYLSVLATAFKMAMSWFEDRREKVQKKVRKFKEEFEAEDETDI